MLPALAGAAQPAIDSFAPWRDDLPALSLDGMAGFSSLAFLHRGQNGLGGTPPVFAVWLEGAQGIVAVDARPTTSIPLAKGTAARHFVTLPDKRRSALLLDVMQRLAASGDYCQLDVLSLIPRYVGLVRGLRPALLLYLFHETTPLTPAARQHRDETARFARAATLANGRFVAMSYGDLWSAWETHTEPAWLPAHAAALRRRYGAA